jgi:ketosteroid isomerase-like protein
VAGFALTGCAADQIHNEKMIAAARGVDQRFVAAYNRGDVEGVMSNYWNSPDLVVYSPVALQAKGWDAVRAGMAQGLAGSSGARLELTESHYQVAGDVVICWGTWRMNVPSANGFALVVEGRYSDVKAQRNGRWVFIMDHASIPWPLAE